MRKKKIRIARFERASLHLLCITCSALPLSYSCGSSLPGSAWHNPANSTLLTMGRVDIAKKRELVSSLYIRRLFFLVSHKLT